MQKIILPYPELNQLRLEIQMEYSTMGAGGLAHFRAICQRRYDELKHSYSTK